MRAKALYQMTSEELNEQLTFWQSRAGHDAELMVSRIEQELLAIASRRAAVQTSVDRMFSL